MNNYLEILKWFYSQGINTPLADYKGELFNKQIFQVQVAAKKSVIPNVIPSNKPSKSKPDSIKIPLETVEIEKLEPTKEKNKHSQDQNKSKKDIIFPADTLNQKTKPNLKLQDMEEYIDKNCSCFLKKYSKNTIIGSGNQSAKLLFIISAPTSSEDIAGKLLINQQRPLLTSLITKMELSQQDIFFMPEVFWHTPGSREPTDLEIKSCLTFLYKIIEIIKPKAIVLSSRAIFNIVFSLTSIVQATGDIKKIDDIPTLIIPPFKFMQKYPPLRKNTWDALSKLQKNILK